MHPPTDCPKITSGADFVATSTAAGSTPPSNNSPPSVPSAVTTNPPGAAPPPFGQPSNSRIPASKMRNRQKERRGLKTLFAHTALFFFGDQLSQEQSDSRLRVGRAMNRFLYHNQRSGCPILRPLLA